MRLRVAPEVSERGARSSTTRVPAAAFGSTTRPRIQQYSQVCPHLVPGAIGAVEEGAPRMVTTPWFDHEIPMTEAAELGTRKVMADHCTVGLVVTTDGSVTELPRSDYQEAEARAIRDMQATGKPFLVLLNTANPDSPETAALAESLERQSGARVLAANLLTLGKKEINEIFTELLGQFPRYQ